MGCNCGGNSKAADAYEYIWTNPRTGEQYAYRTQMEARAVAARNGGGPIREVQKV